MMSKADLKGLVKRHSDSTRKKLVVKIPFTEFETVEGGQCREYEWYAVQLGQLSNVSFASANYNDKTIYVFEKGSFMNCKWTIEIPYGKRSRYLNMVYEINEIVSKDGNVTLFVNNNPYAILRSYLYVEDGESQKEKINEIVSKYSVKVVQDLGGEELFLGATRNREYNCYGFVANMSFDEVRYRFFNAYAFRESDELEKLGYGSSSIRRKKVFISYCHKDKGLVYKVTDALESYGANLWIDKKSIDFGDSIVSSITSGINESDIALLFLSKAILNSNYSEFELHNIMSAMINKEMRWFPVKLDDIDVSKIDPVLNNYKYYDFYNNDSIEELAKAVFDKINSL